MTLVKKFNETAFLNAKNITKTWDFSLAIEKLIEKSDWTTERAEKAVADYKVYMALVKALDGNQPVPNGDIDEIWHMHILDTKAYVDDCMELFGAFLHHYPYFGMLDEENKSDWINAQNETQALWQMIQNEAIYTSNKSAQKCPQACPCVTKTGDELPNGLDFNYQFKVNPTIHTSNQLS